MKRCVPLYVWSGDAANWTRAVQALRRGDIAVVTGPASGPPSAPADVAALAPWVAALHARGVVVVGYTHWSYGNRPLDIVAEDCAQWHRLGADGVWVDETPGQDRDGLLREVRTIHGLVRSWVPHRSTGLRKGVTAWNPGTWDRSLNSIMRALPGSLWCTIECAHNDYAARAAAKRSTWPEREIHLVHGCPSAGVANGVEAAMRVGYGYATSDGFDGNPWDSFRG